MSVEIQGSMRFDRGRCWFVFTNHGGLAVEFSAVKSMDHFRECLAAMHQTCIELEKVNATRTAGGQAPVRQASSVDDHMGKLMQEAELRQAEMLKRAEDKLREQADELADRLKHRGQPDAPNA